SCLLSFLNNLSFFNFKAPVSTWSGELCGEDLHTPRNSRTLLAKVLEDSCNHL
ncbi:hypothetical protein S245_000966, partial [Arachis hypogaea]